MVSKELVTAYQEQVETRALQILLSARAPSTVPPAALIQRSPALFFYHSSNHTDPVQWREGTIFFAERYFVCIRTDADRLLSVAYENIRIRPSSLLTRALMEGSVEWAI